MLREGIKNDVRYLLFLFWRGSMRILAWLDIRIVKAHRAAHLRAARLDRNGDA